MIRDFKLFTIIDHTKNPHLEIGAIHNDVGYEAIREALSAQYNLSNHEPNIQVYDVDIKGDRSLTLRYIPHNEIPLANSHNEVLKHLYQLWGFKVKLEKASDNSEILTISQCPTDDTRHKIE
jgi:spore cortex formation protein SpoVR/YcgB (stage V sporulation)